MIELNVDKVEVTLCRIEHYLQEKNLECFKHMYRYNGRDLFFYFFIKDSYFNVYKLHTDILYDEHFNFEDIFNGWLKWNLDEIVEDISSIDIDYDVDTKYFCSHKNLADTLSFYFRSQDLFDLGFKRPKREERYWRESYVLESVLVVDWSIVYNSNSNSWPKNLEMIKEHIKEKLAHLS